jgi:hypothetical protein
MLSPRTVLIRIGSAGLEPWLPDPREFGAPIAIRASGATIDVYDYRDGRLQRFSVGLHGSQDRITVDFEGGFLYTSQPQGVYRLWLALPSQGHRAASRPVSGSPRTLPQHSS